MVHVLNESDYFRHIQCVTAVYLGEIQSVLYASPCDITPYIMSWCWEPKSSSCDGIFEAVLHNKGSKSRKSPYKTNCIPCIQANLFVLVMVSSLKLVCLELSESKSDGKFWFSARKNHHGPDTKIGYDHANRREDMSSSGLFRSTRSSEAAITHLLEDTCFESSEFL